MSNTFWQLSKPESVRGRAEWDDSMKLEGGRCPIDPGHAPRGERLTDLSVLLTTKRIPDIIWTWYSECLIQDHVLQLFREQGFTGFNVKPVKARMKVRAKKPDPCDDNPGLRPAEIEQVQIPTLWELVVTGWGGMASKESGIELVECCPGCGHSVYTCFTDPVHLIDESQWGGRDFFMVWPMPVFIFVTDRVASAIKRRKLKGAQLKPLSALQCRYGFGPGRLSDWIPEERARQLGEPLGIY